MTLDLSKIGSGKSSNTLLKPREIFSALPSKSLKYTYLRDVQAEVLDQWFARKDKKDCCLKMNTGSGKTLVGLLILKSCMNSGVCPAVYLAPTPYLARQVRKEALELGLSVSEDPRSLGVQRGKDILVTHIHVLINGKTKFGLKHQGDIIPIGSMVVDDVHACLATAESQFTLSLPASHEGYSNLFSLFKSDLEKQSLSTLLEVEQFEPNSMMRVPFWAWIDRCDDVARILHESRSDEELQFVWPLLKDTLPLCRCVFGNKKVEISPHCLPVGVIPSFINAERRVFMSATCADNSVLVSAFNANKDDVEKAITPSSANDVGDRMILVPQEINTSITDVELRELAVKKAKDVNVVVIVPSNYRSDFWAEDAQLTVNSLNLDDGVSRLRKGHVGLVVVINKYDGIDLPGDACRLLIIDGVPVAKRLIDKVEHIVLQGTSVEYLKTIQKIEQGMGRGVRARDDYCAVVLMGASLLGHLFYDNCIRYLTKATSEQFILSEQVGEQIRNQGIKEIEEVIDLCLKRDPEWVALSKTAIVDVGYDSDVTDMSISNCRRRAFEEAKMDDFANASKFIQSIVNLISNESLKGWLMAELAEYTHFENNVEAQKILKSAYALNRRVLRPLSGIKYSRLSSSSKQQAEECLLSVRSQFSEANELVIHANAITDDLVFREESSERFHNALCDAARILGFKAQQPEAECGKGPDVLIAVGNLMYWVVECKNGAVKSREISKRDCNQLAGSVNWFEENYDQSCTMLPIMVHPVSRFEYSATPHASTKIVTAQTLPKFNQVFVKFCRELSRVFLTCNSRDVTKLLISNNLVSNEIVSRFSLPPS